MDCARTWQWMMQALDGMLPADRERKMLIHLGGCRHCTEMWSQLQETALLLPETTEDPGEKLVTGIMLQLPMVSCRGYEYAIDGFAMIAALLLVTGGFLLNAGPAHAGYSGMVQFATGAANSVIAAIDGACHLSVFLLGERWFEETGVAALMAAVVLMAAGAIVASLRMTRSVRGPGLRRTEGMTMRKGRS